MSYYFEAFLQSLGNLDLPAVLLDEREDLPKAAGVYLVVDVQNEEVIYVGKSKNLKKRWSNHNRLGELIKLPFVFIAWFELGDSSGYWLGQEICSWLLSFEQEFIDYYQPILNKHGLRKYTKCEIKLPLENHQRLKNAISHMKIDKNELINDLIVDFLNAKGY